MHIAEPAACRLRFFVYGPDATILSLSQYFPPAAALGAAACFGVGDFSGGVAGRKSSPPSVALTIETIGLVAIPVAIVILPTRWNSADLLFTFLGGAVGGFGLILFYRAMALNLIGIVAPITGVVAAAVPAVVGVAFGGERLHLLQWIGIGAGFTAIVLINGPARTASDGKRTAIGLAIIAGVAFGTFFVLYHLGSSAGAPAFVSGRLGSASVSLSYALITRVSVLPRRQSLPLIVLAGPLDGLGVVLYMYATLFGLLSLSAVLASFYPAFTVLCAWIFLHERLTPLQLLGATLAVVSIALIAAG